MSHHYCLYYFTPAYYSTQTTFDWRKKRAISNLVENAIKFGAQAQVELLEFNEKIVLKIVDEGPGIPQQEVKNVFLPFYRIKKSRNRETGGVGW